MIELLTEANYKALSPSDQNFAKVEIFADDEIRRFSDEDKEKFFKLALSSELGCGRKLQAHGMCGSCVTRYVSRDAAIEANRRYNQKRFVGQVKTLTHNRKNNQQTKVATAMRAVEGGLSIADRGKMRQKLKNEVSRTTVPRIAPEASEILTVDNVSLPISRWSEISGLPVHHIVKVLDTDGMTPSDAIDPNLPRWKSAALSSGFKSSIQKMRWSFSRLLVGLGNDAVFDKLSSLSGDHIDVLQRIFLKKEYNAQIAESLGVARQLIAQREKTALEKALKHFGVLDLAKSVNVSDVDGETVKLTQACQKDTIKAS